jgi:ubiquinone/menaquinone biosynthesis C-methylase UbiE
MNWKHDVKHRFSEKTDAKRWDRMYSSQTLNLADENFRQRRDYAVNYVLDNFNSSDKICDLGCGAGPVTFALLKNDYDVVGLDYSFDMLQNAKKRLEEGNIDHFPLVNSNGESLPLRDEFFDCVVCLGVISYIENYQDMISEMFRILKPGGALIITYRNKYNLLCNDPIALIKHLIKLLLVFLRIRKPDGFKIGRYMKRSEVLQATSDNNLILTGFNGIGFGPFSLWHRKLFKEETSIKLSNYLGRLFYKFNLIFPFEIAADVHILILKK